MLSSTLVVCNYSMLVVGTLTVLIASSTAAFIRPFSPPFLRPANEKSSDLSFHYLQPQQPPSSSLIQDNPAYNTGPVQSLPVNNILPDPIPGRNNMSPNIIEPSPDEMVNRNNPLPAEYSTFNLPHGSVPHQYMPANEVPSINYNLPEPPMPLSALNNNNNNNNVANHRNNNGLVRMGRPQLRQLQMRSTNRNVEAAPSRTPGIRRRNRSNNKVSEGHRLITRALWRIFDALMEKNEKQELHSRMTFIENAIKDMITSDSKLEGLVEMIKEENMGQDQQLMILADNMDDLQRLPSRVEELEAWQLTLERQQDEELQTFWGNKPAYTSCPPPFETVEGECFFLSGETKKTWQDARRECSNYGGDLTAPQNLDSLRTYLKSLTYQPEYVWVGASRQGNGDWVWSSRVEETLLVDMSSATWNEELPNGLGNCMGLYEGAAYRAYDYHCGEHDLFVCQFFFQK